MATIFWKKDEPDDSQVKEVNIPGVFPQPSSKVNSSIVLAAPKPWLRPMNGGQRKHPKHTTDLKRPNAVGIVGDQCPEATVSGKKSNTDQKAKVPVSLKDLSSEDKKRVAKLIKELAKAGEERRVAVNALHNERINFQGKEEFLKKEQEKLIAERDELREKILEYQFLINQYSKQMQHEKNAPSIEREFLIASKIDQLPEIVRLDSKNELIDNDGNLKPPLQTLETEEKLPTYYNVFEVNERNNLNELKTVGREYLEKTMDNHRGLSKSTHLTLSDEKDKILSQDDSQCEKSVIYESPVTQKQDKFCTHEASLHQHKQETGESFIQKTLLDQQGKLLEQQKAIQEQLDNLQAVQQKYATEFSQIATYSEHLKQKLISGEKVIGSSRQECVTDFEAKNSKILTPASRNKDLQEQSGFQDEHFVGEIDENHQKTIGRSESLFPLRDIGKIDNSHNKDSCSMLIQSKEPRANADSFLSKSIEQIPGYLLHTFDKQPKPKTPDNSHLSHASQRAIKHTYFNGEPSSRNINRTSMSVTSHKTKLPQSRERESFSHSPHAFHSKLLSNGALQNSIISAKRNNSLSNSNSIENTIPSRLQSEARNTEVHSREKKQQQSLLCTFEDIESDLHVDEDLELFQPGSYTGFAESILQGKFKNEQIFASTDYSDNDSEPEDNDLLDDVFFLKRSK